jgi:hypothetical protein
MTNEIAGFDDQSIFIYQKETFSKLMNYLE